MFLYLWVCIQIVIESLPLSSSGHVALLEKIFIKLGYQNFLIANAQTIDFLLHGPTIVILLIFFFKNWWNLIFEKQFEIQKIVFPLIFIAIVDGITTCFWYYQISQYGNLTFGFHLTMLLLLILPLAPKQNKKVAWNLLDALILGIVQGLSLMPGISRFASTYICARFLRYKELDAYALSFLIQIPLLIAAFTKGLINCYQDPDFLINTFDLSLFFIMVGSSLVSFCMLFWVHRLIRQNKLHYFALYMMLPIFISMMLS